MYKGVSVSRKMTFIDASLDSYSMSRNGDNDTLNAFFFYETIYLHSSTWIWYARTHIWPQVEMIISQNNILSLYRSYVGSTKVHARYSIIWVIRYKYYYLYSIQSDSLNTRWFWFNNISENSINLTMYSQNGYGSYLKKKKRSAYRHSL